MLNDLHWPVGGAETQLPDQLSWKLAVSIHLAEPVSPHPPPPPVPCDSLQASFGGSVQSFQIVSEGFQLLWFHLDPNKTKQLFTTKLPNSAFKLLPGTLEPGYGSASTINPTVACCSCMAAPCTCSPPASLAGQGGKLLS